jgi:hypothetical protein
LRDELPPKTIRQMGRGTRIDLQLAGQDVGIDDQPGCLEMGEISTGWSRRLMNRPVVL